MKKEHKVNKVCPGERVSCQTKYHENGNLHPRLSSFLKYKKTNSCPYGVTTLKV
nr:zinc-finger domain-containing protein [Francisella tularensis]